MDEALRDFFERRISFDEFARRTAGDWTRMAEMLWRRWRQRLPSGVGAEDLRQELLTHAWVACGSYEPDRGPSIRAYVVWSACAGTQRWVNQQRNSLRRSGVGESRFAVAVSSIGVTDGWLDTVPEDEAMVEPEVALDAKRRFAATIRRAKGVDVFALVAFEDAGGDVAAAARAMFDLVPLRRWAHWAGPEDAAQQICRSLTLMLTETGGMTE